MSEYLRGSIIPITGSDIDGTGVVLTHDEPGSPAWQRIRTQAAVLAEYKPFQEAVLLFDTSPSAAVRKDALCTIEGCIGAFNNIARLREGSPMGVAAPGAAWLAVLNASRSQ